MLSLNSVPHSAQGLADDPAGEVAMARSCRFLGALASFAFACCTSPGASAAEPFTVQLKWVPQAQFMGFYVAKDEGFYAAEGLDVRILHGGPGIIPSDSVRNGSADVVVEWLSTALEERRRGLDLVNVAQIFQKSGLTLVCHKNRGIANPMDLRGRQVGVWYGGSEVPFLQWMHHLGIPVDGSPAGVAVVEQDNTVDRFFDGRTDCISAMTYNEYWQLLHRGVQPRELTVFRYDELGFGMLEDGLYVRASRLDDPVFRDRLVRFVRATLRGWAAAIDNPEEALLIVMKNAPAANRKHQQQMVAEIAKLVAGRQADFGRLRLAQYDRTVDLLNQAASRSGDSSSFPEHAWTHDIWYAAARVHRGLFTYETRYHLDAVLRSPWFYALDLVGTLAFGLAGFLRARERRYDLVGAFVLTALPAVGGGTLRDVLIGGDRSPPFVFKDPTYIYIVIAIVVVGFLWSKVLAPPRWISVRSDRILLVTDTVGLAAFTIIGAKVAILSQLYWFWIPICAAITCSGGGVLMDIFTGREPRTFRGEIYEEIAVLGGLMLIGLLALAAHFTNVKAFIVFAIVLTFAFVYVLRIVVVAKDLRSPPIA
jgi:NitT/TauT family transport system substrate-binding protein